MGGKIYAPVAATKKRHFGTLYNNFLEIPKRHPKIMHNLNKNS